MAKIDNKEWRKSYTVRLSRYEAKLVDAVAAKKNASRSELIRYCVVAYCTAYVKKKK